MTIPPYGLATLLRDHASTTVNRFRFLRIANTASQRYPIVFCYQSPECLTTTPMCRAGLARLSTRSVLGGPASVRTDLAEVVKIVIKFTISRQI